MYRKISFVVFCLMLFFCAEAMAQSKVKNLIYVDKQGQIKWTKDQSNAYFFGVNYTLPFAYAYRAANRLKINPEKAIDADVYHMARMGVDAFRVHVWDTEISDTAGNLLQNEHLRLFDYLVARLKERNIKILITPIAFWGNGYPEKDEHTPGFSYKYGKDKATVNEASIKAQENYLKQLFTHVNPYTKLNYRDDPDIIATELNNEPSHSGTKKSVTDYINRLAAATRSTGWSKPVFYNISQNSYYAGAVAASTVNGFSFQWYPVALVAGHEQKGNFLQNINRYNIPFDTIPAFRNKARIIYEFDAADMLASYMYPSIARSFKNAGFQWVTQFAYDPMSTAASNTEYQTHYLNLAYTPGKAISMLIANRAFHTLPVDKKYGGQIDTLFKNFRISYRKSLSEMNSEQEFYHSNTTESKPVNPAKLLHIAGVGSSGMVRYAGYGAYFIDKIREGVWRLEVMPDAISIRDPFEKASPEKEVTHIQWQNEPMQIKLPDLGTGFSIKALNEGNTNKTTAGNDASFTIKPGTYLLTRAGIKNVRLNGKDRLGNIRLDEFAAPEPAKKEPYVQHTPPVEISPGVAFPIRAKMVEVDSADKVMVEIGRTNARPVTLEMKRKSAYDYEAIVPAADVTPGRLSYRIIIESKDKQYRVFPGGYAKNPYDWDYFPADSWQTYVAKPAGKLLLFDAGTDEKRSNTYASNRTEHPRFVAGNKTGEMAFSMKADGKNGRSLTGLQLFVSDKLSGRASELLSFKKLVVKGGTAGGGAATLRVALVSADGNSRAAYIRLEKPGQEMAVPLSSLKSDSTLLLPRPYPDFQPLWFKGNSPESFKLKNTDKLEITCTTKTGAKSASAVEVSTIWLEQ